MLVSALRPLVVSLPRIIALCAMIALASSSFGQSVVGPITTKTLNVGGPGGFSCYSPASDPPKLNDGTTIAKGVCVFSYDSVEHQLKLIVTNTTPEVGGQPTPVIREIYVNLPPLLVSSVTLASQSSPFVNQPNFVLSYDTNTSDMSGSLPAGCFGRFGIRLSNPAGLAGSIQAVADLLPGPPNSMVKGPVTFILNITPAGGPGGGLLAATFAASHSYNDDPEGKRAEAVFKFESNPGSLAAGFVSNGLVGNGGNANGFVVGNPLPGQMVTFVAGGTPNWTGWLLASLDPGPTPFFGVYYPIGEIYYILYHGTIPQQGWASIPIVLPNPQPLTIAPPTGGIATPVYFLVVLVSPSLRVVSVSEQFTLDVHF